MTKLINYMIWIGVWLASMTASSQYNTKSWHGEKASRSPFFAKSSGIKRPPGRVVFVKDSIDSRNIIPEIRILITLADNNTTPIDIIINSPGGNPTIGLQFINAMHYAQAKNIILKCYVSGRASSMAIYILAECNERYAFKYSILLWHAMYITHAKNLTARKLYKLSSQTKILEDELIILLKKSLNIADKIFYEHYEKGTIFTVSAFRNYINKDWIEITNDIPHAALMWRPGTINTK